MGNKHLLLSDDMYAYFSSCSLRENAIQAQLRAETLMQSEQGYMMTSPEQAQFLAMLIKLMGVRRAIEVGVFTGYGSLAIAMALPEEGELIACDISAQWPAIGKPYWEQAGVEHKIDLKIAPAMETLQGLLQQGKESTVDFIFIDADKVNYSRYYELSLRLLRSGGLIVFDNVLRINTAFVNQRENPAAKAVYELNQRLLEDQSVDISMLPIGEGMTLVRKR